MAESVLAPHRHDADELLVGFARALRSAGVGVTPDRTRAYLEATALVGLDDQRATYWSGRATLCAAPDDLDPYDQVFTAWFLGPGHAISRPPREDRRSVQAALETGDGDGAGEELDDEVLRAMASDSEVLRHRDVAGMSATERARLAAMFAELRPRAPQRPASRRTPWRRGSLDAQRTLRETLKRMGEPGDLAWRRRRTRPRRVVLLLDVSGSMSAYADALLRLAHRFAVSTAGGRASGGVEVFTVGTRLTRVTGAMRVRDPERAIVAAGETVPDWSGGTRLGESLQVFLDRWGQRGLARGAVVVVCSDGWERGDARVLGEQMQRLSRVAHRVVWMNPHVGKAGYLPVQQGIVAALPHVDDLVAGHSMAAFEELIEVVAVREVLPELAAWWREGRSVGMGTVVATFRSAPRPPGASMLVGPSGEAVGSVSGGCVEGAVYELGREIVATGVPRLHRYGVSDDDAFAVGLTCGGILDVYVEKVDPTTFPELGAIADDVEAGRPVAVATVVEHPDPAWVGRRLVVRPGESPGESPAGSPGEGPPQVSGSLGSARADAAVADDTLGMLASGHDQTLTYGPDGERRGEGMRVFVWSFAPAPRMLVFGAIDFAAAVARMGNFLGYRVTVCDARPVFATGSRFPSADEVVVKWPHRYLREEIEAGRLDQRSVLCVLTHDPKFDVPLLEVALREAGRGGVAYVGAMGSRRTHEDRMARLVEAGLSDTELGRLSSPVGLDLGARTPEETAVSIAAEIIALRWGGRGERLAALDGRIHH